MKYYARKLNRYVGKYGEIYTIVLVILVLIGITIISTTMVSRTVAATIDGQEYKFETKAHIIEKALAEANIDYSDEDYLSQPASAYIYDNVEFELTHAKNFTVTADGKTKKFKSLEKTVGAALDEKKVKVGEIDIVEPKKDAELKEGMSVVVKRVVIKEETAEEDVDFNTIKKDDSSLAEGKTKVVSEGKKGKDKVTYKITYTDGKETKRKEISRETVTKPVDEVVNVGTAVSFNGKLYKKKLTVRAYSYTGGGRTASGTRARVGEIAVDPRVIPIGTTVYIPGIGERRAEDTGGNIKGNKIDIYMNSLGACRRWGVRTITIYVN